MEFAAILGLLGVVLLVAYFIGIYNGLIALKNAVLNDRANIEVILKQRKPSILFQKQRSALFLLE